MSAPYTADDGARITVDREDNGWALNCTICGYVASDPDDKAYVEENADVHHSWHNGEHAREQARR